MKALYPGPGSLVIEEPGTPARMVRKEFTQTVLRSVIDVHASEVRFTRCRNLSFVRLASKRGKSDVLCRCQNAALGQFDANSQTVTEIVALGDWKVPPDWSIRVPGEARVESEGLPIQPWTGFGG
jgi:hypothetical protein